MSRQDIGNQNIDAKDQYQCMQCGVSLVGIKLDVTIQNVRLDPSLSLFKIYHLPFPRHTSGKSKILILFLNFPRYWGQKCRGKLK